MDLLLSVYVDALKFAGPTKNMSKGWQLVVASLELDPPQLLNLYLGFVHERKDVKIGDSTVQVMAYNMEEFLKSSVELYVELFPSAPSRTSASSARVASPCTLEPHEHAPAAVPAPEGRAATGEVDLTDFDHQGGTDPAEAKEKSFHTAAARVVMKVMRAARMPGQTS